MRFTIRDLVWLMLVVALMLAWWMDHNRQDLEIGELRFELVVEKATDYRVPLAPQESAE